MHFVVTLVGTIAVTDENGKSPPDADELLEAHLDAVMDELERLKAGDPDIELDLTECHVKFAVLVEASDPDAAIANASPVVRSAIHAAGGSTPDWPDSDARVWSVRRVTMSVRAVELAAA
jgi:hypothetical protein